MAKKNKWIQKAINPKHKGYCTPMTKKTCTPARKAFAKRAKAGKLQAGGSDQQVLDPNFDPLDQMQQQVGIPAPSTQQVQNVGGEKLSNPGSFANTQAGQKIMSRFQKNNAIIKDVNEGITAVTNVANKIQEQKQKREEYLQTLRSMTPKFMTNNNQGGLNNIPAYTMYGGNDRNYPSMEVGGELDYMMVGGPISSDPYDYDSKSSEERQLEGIAHKAFYGSNSVIPAYKAGGEVSSDKAKEILRDGTVHGHPLTDKQKRYFGWIAGGKKMLGGFGYGHMSGYQAGGPTVTPQTSQGVQTTPNPEDYYKSSAMLSYYKNKLNDQLKAKNAQGFGDYFKGLQGARTAGGNKAQEYIQNSQYNDYLTPDEVKKTLGSDKDYQNYLNSLKSVNTYNVKQGQQPLYGNIEGESDDPSKLNYGRRFASLQVTPSFGSSVHGAEGDKRYSRNYEYNPQTGQVEFKEEGDYSLRPQGFSVPPSNTTQTPTTGAVTSRQYGGKKRYKVGGVQGKFTTAYHNTSYNVGDEVDLTPAQIKELKKQGYKIKVG